MAQTIINVNQTQNSSIIYLLNGNSIVSPIYINNMQHPLAPYTAGAPVIYGTASNDFTYLPGKTAYYSSVADNGSGWSRFYFASGHPFLTDDRVLLYGTNNYYDFKKVTYIDSTHVDMQSSYTGPSTGYLAFGSKFKCNIPEYYKFKLSYNAYFRSTYNGNSTVYFLLENNAGIIASTTTTTSCTNDTTFHQVLLPAITIDIAQNDIIEFDYYCDGIHDILFESLIMNIDKVI
jgi:hypothetical protein